MPDSCDILKNAVLENCRLSDKENSNQIKLVKPFPVQSVHFWNSNIVSYENLNILKKRRNRDGR